MKNPPKHKQEEMKKIDGYCITAYIDYVVDMNAGRKIKNDCIKHIFIKKKEKLTKLASLFVFINIWELKDIS